jgi:hypothetical protein
MAALENRKQGGRRLPFGHREVPVPAFKTLCSIRSREDRADGTYYRGRLSSRKSTRCSAMQFLLRRRSFIELRLYRARIRCKNAFSIPDLDGRSLGRESAKRMSDPNIHEHN